MSLDVLEILSFAFWPMNWFWWCLLGALWIVLALLYALAGGPFGWGCVAAVCIVIFASAYDLWRNAADV
ncbi:hypothetical protein Q4578_10195 [Shimia thalassica]|uniref:hypothetical protein n=1 Tax=Shimia thalassica TaxID=1715693 RepID=UPI0026E32D12|nr:hypothetical protein [Shimia thalassica]MDO6521961.1 hypothetical protein [Shimia thalassica]